MTNSPPPLRELSQPFQSPTRKKTQSSNNIISIEMILVQLKSASRFIDINSEKLPPLENILENPSEPLGYLQEDLRFTLLEKERSVSLPESLFEQYDFLQCKTFMGLFPEINRVWLSIDHRLFLWDYETDSFHLYQDQDQIIVSVGLVKPLAGVFIDQIQYLLVIATVTEISIVGVAFSGKNAKSEIQLYNTQMTTSSDNIVMNCIQGTDTGRIFMCGNNGQLYELHYQTNDSSFFSKKCRKTSLNTSIPLIGAVFSTWINDTPITSVAIDNKRKLLYTLNINSEIQLVYLGNDGGSFERIRKFTDLAGSLRNQADMYTFNGDFKKLTIVSIFVVDPSESLYITLVAILSNGGRLYFTTSNRSTNHATKLIVSRPDTLSTVTYRPPTPFPTIPNQPDSNSVVHVAYYEKSYKKGLSISALIVNEEIDTINTTCLDISTPSTGKKKKYQEFTSSSSLEGKVWAISEVPGFADDLELGETLNELSTQLTQKPRKILFLTNSGVLIYKKNRPFDILQQRLTESMGQVTSDLTLFFQHFGAAQSCSMCLAIACGNPIIASIKTLPSMSPKFSNPAVASAARKFFFDMGGKPSVNVDQEAAKRNAAVDPVLFSTSDVQYSGRHDGLVLYLTRILKPIWKKRIIKEKNGDKFETNTSSENYLLIQRQLEGLNEFLNQNSFFTQIATANDIVNSTLTQNDLHALQNERQSLNNLHNLIKQSIEGISFLLLLIDHNINSIIRKVKDRREITDLTFESLVVAPNGRSVSKSLINEIVNRQIENQIEVGTISDLLRARCPSFCSPDDVLFYKGMEYLLKSKSSKDRGREREINLNESLKLFSGVCESISFEKLEIICEIYRDLRFHSGAIELCLLYAQRHDPAGYGLAYYMQGENRIDDSRMEFYDLRKRCYQIIFGLLPFEYNNQTYIKSSNVFENVEYEKQVFQLAASSSDELFHYLFYEYLKSQDYIDQLMQIRSPFIIDWMMARKEEIDYADLLWRYYVELGQYLNASRILGDIAMSQTYPINLIERIEYLSRALANSRSISSVTNSDDAMFIRHLEDVMEVAQVQLEVVNAIQNMRELNYLLPELNGKLLELGDLFSKYTSPLGLQELSLIVLYAAGYNRKSLIESIWNSIIEKETNSVVLREKMLQLGKRFYPDENLFPIKYLVNSLESKWYGLKGDGSIQGWIPLVFVEIGVPFEIIFEAYNNLFEERGGVWASVGSVSYLLQDIYMLLDEWLRNCSSPMNIRQRETFPVKFVDECIGKYIVFPISVDNGVLTKLQAIPLRLRKIFG